MSRGSERKRIRKKIVEILKSADIDEIGESVFSRRSTASNSEELPLINIYINDESIERFEESPKSYRRELSVALEIMSTHSTDEELSDELDDLSEAVERVMEETTQLYDMKNNSNSCKLINDYELQRAAYDTEGLGENPVGSVTLSYGIEYYTDEEKSEKLNDLKTIHNDWQANGNEDGQAKDVISYEVEQ